MNDKYNYLKKFLPPHPAYQGTNRNWFFPVSLEQVQEAEKNLNLSLPSQLKEFYREIGYGSLYAPDGAPEGYRTYLSNQILSPDVIEDIMLLGHESGYIDQATYEYLEPGDLPFFEMYDSSYFLLMKLNSDNPNAVWTTGDSTSDKASLRPIKIEDSFEKFIWRLYYESPSFYSDIVEAVLAQEQP